MALPKLRGGGTSPIDKKATPGGEVLRQRYRYLTAELDYVDTVVCLTLGRVDLGVGTGEINAGSRGCRRGIAKECSV